MAKYNTLVMCSGGLDSVVMLYHLMRQGSTCRIVYGNFGKRVTAQELAIVRRLSVVLNVPVDVIDVLGLSQLQRSYDSPIRLLDEELDIDLKPTARRFYTGGTREDGAFITGFHCILSVCSYAAHLTDGENIAVAVTKDQLAGFPNIDQAFETWERCVGLFNPGVRLSVLTPFIDKTKAEIAALGHSLGVSLAETWSCIASSTSVHCGKCHQCISRKQAFATAGILDPTAYKP